MRTFAERMADTYALVDLMDPDEFRDLLRGIREDDDPFACPIEGPVS